MMTRVLPETLTLARYDAACRALAVAKSTDEVKKIRDVATAMKAYARQAKNRQLEIDAAEIRVRAERRVGELIQAQKASVGLAKGNAGRGRPKLGGTKKELPKNTPPTLADAGIDKRLSARGQQLAAVPEKQFEKLVTDWRVRTERDGDRIRSEILPPKLAVHHSSETPEHYTPQSFLDAVRAVFGEIPDLDPCSNSREHPNVPAHKHYTQEDDGCARPWDGRVFMNPPYGREIAAWIDKVRAEWKRGGLSELIALLPARTDTEWFERLTVETDDAVICFLRGRLTFVGNHDPAPFPSMAVYFGPHHDRFATVFGELGSLWQRPARPTEWFVDHE